MKKIDLIAGLKLGDLIRTNGDGGSAMKREVIGKICRIELRSFWIANNEVSGSYCDNPYEKEYKYTWEIRRDNEDCFVIKWKSTTKEYNKYLREKYKK